MWSVGWGWWCGRCADDMSLSIHHRGHAPSWSGRTPGSQTPSVPATPSPRRQKTLRHRGLKNGHSRPGGCGCGEEEGVVVCGVVCVVCVERCVSVCFSFSLYFSSCSFAGICLVRHVAWYAWA